MSGGEAKVSDLLPGEFTAAVEAFRAQLAPLGNHGLQSEKNLRVITPVLPNTGNQLRPASLQTQTLVPEATKVNQAQINPLALAAKQTDNFEYVNAESIEDSHG